MAYRAPHTYPCTSSGTREDVIWSVGVTLNKAVSGEDWRKSFGPISPNLFTYKTPQHLDIWVGTISSNTCQTVIKDAAP